MPDRAAVAVALAGRLRRAGVATTLADVEAMLRATDSLQSATRRPARLPTAAAGPQQRAALRTAARLTLVHRREDLDRFDRIVEGVLDDLMPVSPDPGGGARRTFPAPSPGSDDGGRGLPWITPRALPTGTLDDAGADHTVPVRRPRPEAALLDLPFETLEPEQVAALGRWLSDRARDWPTRTSRRRRTASAGSALDLRATLRRARRTGWEPVVLRHEAPRRRPRRIVMVCDVSRSMQADVTPLLHLMRALVLAGPAEVFTAGTALSRVTASLRRPEAGEAWAATAALTADRMGGTRLADSLATLLGPRHEPLLRGATVLVASDGWDSAAPEELARVVGRIHRRAHRLLWAHPRASVAGFEPRVPTLAAALGNCDETLAAGSFAELAYVLDRVLRR